MRNVNIRLYILLCAIILQHLSGCGNNKDNISNSPPDQHVDKYKNITIIDIHNHDAEAYKYKGSISTWDMYGIDKIVLFGKISESLAVTTDEIALKAYRENTGRFFPFMAAINIHDSTCLTYIKDNFNTGFFGIGEVVAASTNSPVASKLEWKGSHPMDGYFPGVYELCALHKKPILLHIDPPSGYPVEKLKEAAAKYPGTKFIFAHANAYNSPANIENLLKNYNNIYIDFFPGFTAYNPDSNNKLSDFVPVIKAYPNKFMLSSDSGYGIDYDKAYTAYYDLFDMLDEDVVIKIAGQNFLDLVGE